MFSTRHDNPGSKLFANQFDGSDFISRSHDVRMDLGAKCKLGFIDGSCAKPAEEGDALSRWTRTDYMVRCWISNSMAKNISNSFRYVNSAKEL